jgi:hypothetical protein
VRRDLFQFLLFGASIPPSTTYNFYSSSGQSWFERDLVSDRLDDTTLLVPISSSQALVDKYYSTLQTSCASNRSKSLLCWWCVL